MQAALTVNYTITEKSKGFTERRTPVTAETALKAIQDARANPSITVEITDELGNVVSELQLRKALEL